MYGKLASVSCDPECGFMVQSHDEKEVIDDTRSHVKKIHNGKATEKEIKKMIKWT